MSDETREAVDIRTHGLSDAALGSGGWGALLVFGDREDELRGGETETTDRRMGLTASVRALEGLRGPHRVRIRTTCAAVREGVTEWHRRKAAGGGDPVEDEDLLRRLAAAMAPHVVSWSWPRNAVVGRGDARAIELALQGMRESSADTEPDGDDRCVHDMTAAWCSLCKAPPRGVLARGYRTEAGNAYHNDRHCEWMYKGQRRAERQGRNVRDVVRVNWADVNPGDLQPCGWCCTRRWLRRHGH